MPKEGTNIYQSKLFTVPNILSLFRLCLIPFIVWLYIKKQDYLWTLLILTLSGVTDIVDGIIARKCNMISDFGKAFDPFADKLTQIAMLFCLVSRFKYMIYPLALIVFKELTTVALYSMMAIHLIWFNIPHTLSLILVGICIGIMLMSFIMYSVQNIKAIKSGKFEES